MSSNLPDDLNGGDVFQLVFVTSLSNQEAMSTDINLYNTNVNTMWSGSSLKTDIETFLGVSPITWKCIGSTATDDANTNAVVGSGISGVYRLDQTKVAVSAVDMWDGSLVASISIDENGNAVSPPGTGNVWTGSQTDGTADATNPLGEHEVAIGESSSTSNDWIAQGTEHSEEDEVPILKRLYALSEELTWPASAAAAAAAGGGFPHLYSHDVSGSFIDASAVRSVASADVAEFHAALEPEIEIDDDVHFINIATKRAVTATEFKQMFYARGDDEFSIANVYECPDIASNILASVWGKRAIYVAPGDPSQNTLPYNASRVINYNILSSRPNDPSGVDIAYGYTTDLQRNFYAYHEVMGNLEKDLCIKKENWTLCSRMALEDQLHSLAFAPEETDDVCMTISCARKWSEVEDALAESCLAENNIIGLGDYVDLYINVRVSNGNLTTKDTIIRIRFSVRLTRGPDDLGNWNVVSRNAASAILTTGIPRDAVEGGNLQYANASLTEIDPNSNPSYVQPPNTTSPGDLNTATDPHDHDSSTSSSSSSSSSYEASIYVTGLTYTGLNGEAYTADRELYLIKYNLSGVRQWTTVSNLVTAGKNIWGMDVAIDSNHNLYVAGATTGAYAAGAATPAATDIILIKYNSLGVQQWARQITTGSTSKGFSITVDSNDSVYICGMAKSSLPSVNISMPVNTNTNFFLIKYDVNGNKQWTDQWGAGAIDIAYGVSAIDNNNIYIVGLAREHGVTTSFPNTPTGPCSAAGGENDTAQLGSDDIFIVKYDESLGDPTNTGYRKWARRTGGAGATADQAGSAIAIASDGSILVTGSTSGAMDGANQGSNDIVILKYNSSGVQQWVKQLGSGSSDVGQAITTDSLGNIYITGYTKGDLPGSGSSGNTTRSPFLVKYNSSGIVQFVKQFSTGTANGHGSGITTDDNNNVYITGWTNDETYEGIANPSQSFGAFTSKYNSSGDHQWTIMEGNADGTNTGANQDDPNAFNDQPGIIFG